MPEHSLPPSPRSCYMYSVVAEIYVLCSNTVFAFISQVLLSQVHRLRALDLLGRFLDLGPWAVSLVSAYYGHLFGRGNIISV